MALISVVPPAGLTQARYLVKRLRLAMPNLRVTVGCWSLETELREEWTERLVQAGAVEVYYSITDAKLKLSELSHLTHRVSLNEVKSLRRGDDGKKGAVPRG